ncbi:YihY/virulence factor BrkB family protein [Rossellomorea aquimaris]|uniref:YihY/virulence factor BrkB family protein n=1 Tax=Rossellomorea aquimaris TaxID=189382 RepID=UPI001CD30204|nr:YihY/virulence factor BrkB family protein [Rossellomorea aquimaris]MCA1056683.1 YihY/virulence factor BrkB family protein [Rossellomorea aquimaris]
MKLLVYPKEVIGRFFKERFFDQSAQLAYYLLLSIFPFLLFVFSLLSYLPISETNVLLLIKPFAPEKSYSIIHDNVERILYNQRGDVLSISIIFTFWLASMAVQSMVRSLNQAYKIERKKPFFIALFYDLLLTVGFMVLISFSLVVPVVEEYIRHARFTSGKLQGEWSQLWVMGKWGLSSIFMLLLFIFLYMVVPSRRISFMHVLPGALLATFGWQGVSWLYGTYVKLNDYTQFYGQLGSVITLVVWFYISSTILLIGGLLNGSVADRN